MIIGVDFDNTIIDYNDFFYLAGRSLGVLPEKPDFVKKTIREYLVQNDREDDWIRIQGLVYGKYIQNASVMDGFLSFVKECNTKGWNIYIVSHKTRQPKKGEMLDLHDAALRWLEKNRIYGRAIHGPVKGVYFNATRSDKITMINHLGCEIVIDDLKEVLEHPGLDSSILKILYSPHDDSNQKHTGYFTTTHWNQINSLITEKYG